MTILTFSKSSVQQVRRFLEAHLVFVILAALTILSALTFLFYYQSGLGLAYNDARSHLDIGRRVVEGLKPGVAQLGSVWLPLTHVLMISTIWNDFMWHSGLAGAIWSMAAFVFTGILIYRFLQKLQVGMFGRIFGVAVFATNLNILYLQSTAMTELILLATMTAGVYELLLWFKEDKIAYLVKAGFWIMLSTLVRYDGWFLLAFATLLVALYTIWRKGYKTTEGVIILFCTLGGVGIFLWLLWNQLIFKDALYFAFGPYSARAQQLQLESAGNLPTKGDWLLSLKFYWYALAYNSNAFIVIVGLLGASALWLAKKLPVGVRVATVALTAPFFFNVIALYLGHSVLFIQGLSGDVWFNVRYGVMMVPSLAVFLGYLVNRFADLKWLVTGLVAFVTFFAMVNADAVTIDDARVGSSQKNVSEVSSWLAQNAKDEKGFILISAASHDAIIFSSGLPMKKFIHEGTGAYWKSATTSPDRWARWIVMRTYSDTDQTYYLVKNTPGYERYELVESYPFADIYELKPEYLPDLITEPVIGKQK